MPCGIGLGMRVMVTLLIFMEVQFASFQCSVFRNEKAATDSPNWGKPWRPNFWWWMQWTALELRRSE
jgi:hypothetical protein